MTALTVIECDTCRRTHRGATTTFADFERIYLYDQGWTHTPPDTDTCPTCTRIGLTTFLATLDEPETKP